MEGATNMGSELNSALNTNITPSGIVENFIGMLPWVGVMVGASFVIHEVRKMIKGAAKGKVRL